MSNGNYRLDSPKWGEEHTPYSLRTLGKNIGKSIGENVEISPNIPPVHPLYYRILILMANPPQGSRMLLCTLVRIRTSLLGVNALRYPLCKYFLPRQFLLLTA